MSFIQELQQNLMNNRMNFNLNLFSEFSSSANDILLFIISLIAIIGVYFWYIDRVYSSRYIFKNPTQLGFFYDLITKGLLGFSVFLGFLKVLKHMFLLLNLLGIIAYILFGIHGVMFVIILEVISTLKMVQDYQIVLKKGGEKNNNYISSYVIITSLNKYFISIIKSISSKKFGYVLAFVLISLILHIIKPEYFFIWASVWLIVYLMKCINLKYEINLLLKKPLFSTVEYISGDIESNLILYQTTPTDYRFKQKNTRDEKIIPASSIKKIYYDYDSELNDLERVINLKILEDDSAAKWLINKTILNMISSLKPITFYREAVIYSKKKDFEKAEKCLAEAIKLDNTYKNIAKDDADFENIRNENWFESLIDMQENKSS